MENKILSTCINYIYNIPINSNLPKLDLSSITWPELKERYSVHLEN